MESPELKTVTVFGGHRDGKDQTTIDKVEALGRCLVKHKVDLIYGSGQDGLMGRVAKAVFDGGRQVLGIVPRFLVADFLGQKEKFETYGELKYVDTMHTRKLEMFEGADGFIAVPGGFGTLDETVEMITWYQLGTHKKPIGLLNISNFFDPILQWASLGVEKGFIPEFVLSVLVVSDDPEDLMNKLKEKLKELNSS